MAFDPRIRVDEESVLYCKNLVCLAIDSVFSFDNSKREVLNVHGLESQVQRDLFVDWFTVLVKEVLQAEIHQAIGPIDYGYRTPEGMVIKMYVPSGTKPIEFHVTPGVLALVNPIALKASARALRNDRGPQVWWKARVSSKIHGEGLLLHMMRIIGQQNCYEGSWEMGHALLFFTQPNGPQTSFFPIDQSVEIFIRVPGPGHGRSSEKTAHRWVSRFRSLLAFAIGAQLDDGVLFPVVRMEDHEKISENKPRPNFPIAGIPVWPQIDAIYSTCKREGLDRFFGALKSYEVALSQTNSSASLVFFIMAIEALTVPNTRSWKGSRKRFTRYLLTHCKDCLQKTLAHGNFQQAFGNIGSIEEFASVLYSLRSEIVHTGGLTDITNLRTIVYDHEPSRIALVADVARDAILKFLARPSLSSSSVEQDQSKIVLQPSKALFARLVQAAGGEGGKERVEQWLLNKLKDEFGQ